MKKIILGLCILVALTTINQSCKKYPEGPSFSLLTKTQRLACTWKITSYTVNGTDQLGVINALLPNYSETYDKSGNYSYSADNASGSGKWEFQNNKLEIKRSGVSGQSSATLTILKLKSKEFWYSYKENGDEVIVHMIPK